MRPTQRKPGTRQASALSVWLRSVCRQPRVAWWCALHVLLCVIGRKHGHPFVSGRPGSVTVTALLGPRDAGRVFAEIARLRDEEGADVALLAQVAAQRAWAGANAGQCIAAVIGASAIAAGDVGELGRRLVALAPEHGGVPVVGGPLDGLCICWPWVNVALQRFPLRRRLDGYGLCDDGEAETIAYYELDRTGRVAKYLTSLQPRRRREESTHAAT